MSAPRPRLALRLLQQGAALGERLRGERALPGADALHAAASSAAGGLDDFGDTDYREGLAVLLEAYAKEARLTPFGRGMLKAQLVAILRARLEAVAAWKREPSLRSVRIEAPLFVLGLPRTGTSALHALLAQDPTKQVLEYWLAQSPRPRPPRESWEREPRYRAAVRELRTVYWIDPGLRAIHDLTADGPEECRHLLGQSFTDDTFDSNATIPSYTAWYRERDMRASYRWHRAVLALIGSTSPERRWVLKYPAHMAHLEALLEVYPDACFVFTHRDPAQVLPSLCSLVTRWRGLYERDADVARVARWQVAMWAERIEHALAVRARLPADRVFDLAHAEIVADPIAAVRGLHDHFGESLNAAGEARLRAWRDAHPPAAHGEHRVQPEDFGLEAGALRERFASYLGHLRERTRLGGAPPNGL